MQNEKIKMGKEFPKPNFFFNTKKEIGLFEGMFKDKISF